MNDKNEYKGIFYDDNSERKYYEGGAHFSYEALVNILKNKKKQQIINENKAFIQKKEIDKENVLKQVQIVSRQKNFSMKNIFSCDNQVKKKIKKNNNNNANNDYNYDFKIKKINFLRNNVSKEKSLPKKKIKPKKKNMKQSNSVIQIGTSDKHKLK